MFKTRLDMEATPYVFVYGTLKSMYANNRLLSSSEFIGDGFVPNGGALKGYGIPFFIPSFQISSSSVGDIHGEVWEVDSPNTLANLDGLESHPNLYYRSIVTVSVPKEGEDMGDYILSHDLGIETYRCWTYFFSRSKLWGDEIEDDLRQEDGSYRF